MILGYLILAHLLGDFIFQPNRLVIWKIKSKFGILAHAGIHFFLNLLLLSPFIWNGHYWLIAAAFIICFVHFWIDKTKISYDLRHHKKVIPFLLDQLMHFLTILLVVFFTQNLPLYLPSGDFYEIYGNSYLTIFLSFIVICSTVVEIYHFQKIREKNHAATLKLNHKEMLLRVIIFTLIYALLIGLFISHNFTR